MDLWLAKVSEPGGPEYLGLFSTPDLAKEACQDSANEYFGAAHTAALAWRGDGKYCSASHYSPQYAGGSSFFQIIRFTVDERRGS